MFVDVIPSEHSIGIHPLTYSVPEAFEDNIAPGCIVEIPVRNSTEYWVVIWFREYAPENMELKDIIQVITSKKILAAYQIAMIMEISMRYLIPIHRVLGFFLSKTVIKRLLKKEFLQINEEVEKIQNELAVEEIVILKESIITGKILKNYIEEWTIILCPDDLSIYRIEEELSEFKNILYIPNESTETKKAQSWIDIKNKKYDIIVWNRKILYYNLSEYKKIIYLEDAFGREYFHYPIKIEYIDILNILNQQGTFNISILTSVPRLTTLKIFHHFNTIYI